MPAYLDNIWQDQQTIRGFGDALNNNFASLVEAKARQRQQEQSAALNAAYYTLERQKMALQQPGMDAQTGLDRARTAQLAAQTGIMQQQQRDMTSLRDAAMQQYMQANPVMRQVQQPTLPQGNMPMTPTSNMMQQAMPQQVQSTMGPGAPTMANLGQLNAATINAILASQAAQSPTSAEHILEGNILRPGDVRQNMITGQREPQVSGFLSPYQMIQADLGQKRLTQGEELGTRRADIAERSVDERERADRAREEKPSLEAEAARALQIANDKKLGRTSNNNKGIATPKVGEVRRGYRYKGGNPADQSSWEAAQ